MEQHQGGGKTATGLHTCIARYCLPFCMPHRGLLLPKLAYVFKNCALPKDALPACPADSFAGPSWPIMRGSCALVAWRCYPVFWQRCKRPIATSCRGVVSLLLYLLQVSEKYSAGKCGTRCGTSCHSAGHLTSLPLASAADSRGKQLRGCRNPVPAAGLPGPYEDGPQEFPPAACNCSRCCTAGRRCFSDGAYCAAAACSFQLLHTHDREMHAALRQPACSAGSSCAARLISATWCALPGAGDCHFAEAMRRVEGCHDTLTLH